ncbi:13352_t:CDS:2 [Ambispora gerdemannii]|uniref:13352_t:CDS:1 n=1 Tax=Ambispora gerdemannii TaxID=144530 RepID=A0A9N9BTM5_9GLOM|nr:13352_t:CDS:2 [Ambispora gerdemannii]
MSSKPAPKLGELVIVVIAAKNLVNREAIGKADPFATFRIGSHAKRTKTVKRGGQNPEWDEEIRFQLLDEPSNKKMKIQVYNEDKREHELLGETMIELNEVLTKGEWDGKEVGEICLEMTLYRPEPPPGAAQGIINSSHPQRPPANAVPVTAPHQQQPYNNLTHTPSLSAHQSPNLTTAYPQQQQLNSQYPPPHSTSPNPAPAAVNYSPQNNVYPPVNNSTYHPPPVHQTSGTFYSPAIQSRPLPQHQATLPLQPPVTSGYPPASGVSGYPQVSSPPVQSSPLPLNSPPPVNPGVPLSFPVPVAPHSINGGYPPSNAYPPNNQYNYGFPPNNIYQNQQAYPPTNVYPPPAQAGSQPYPPPQFGQAYPPYPPST